MSIMKLEIGAVTEIVCICWGVSRVTNTPLPGPFRKALKRLHGSAKTNQRRSLSKVSERHMCQNSLFVWCELKKHKICALRCLKLCLKDTLFPNWAASCTLWHVLHSYVRLLCQAIAFQLTVFTQPLSLFLSFPLIPPQRDLFGLTQMTLLVWRNIPVTWLEASQHLLLWIKCTQREVAGVVYKNEHLNAAQAHTVTSFVAAQQLGCSFSWMGTVKVVRFCFFFILYNKLIMPAHWAPLWLECISKVKWATNNLIS